MISAADSPTSAAKPYRPYTADLTSLVLLRTLPTIPAATHHAATRYASRTAIVPTTATGEAISGFGPDTVVFRNPRRARVDSSSLDQGPENVGRSPIFLLDSAPS